MSTTIGVIAAGGAGSRMGTDKALVDFAGRPFLDHVATALEGTGMPVVVSGREYGFRGYDTVPDIRDFDGGGPALGLLSVFRRYAAADLFLVAVDQPLLRPATVQSLLDLPGDAVVPEVAGHPQVTCALYRNTCRKPLESLLSSGEFKLRVLLSEVTTTLVPESEWRTWAEDGRSWMSLDTPEAVREAETLL